MNNGILITLAVLITVTYSRSRSNVGDKLVSFMKNLDSRNSDVLKWKNFVNSENSNHRPISRLTRGKDIDDNNIDVRIAKHKAKVLQRARVDEPELNSGLETGFLSQKLDKESYRMDPVLNNMRRSGIKARRSRVSDTDASDSGTSSSSLELKNWKTEWNEQWMKKKMEALNSTGPRGDVVNMVAARPWGVPCGDPNQHDMPWGTCMLAAECDGEYRIYRGDYFCGRTHFVCCGLQLSTYDAYQGFDVSFADSSLQTDSAEKRQQGENSRERRKKRKARERRRRKRNREVRKRKIKRNIKKMVKEVQKILNRAYRNSSTIRRKKTKTLKKFIKYLKRKYRKDRDAVKDIHEVQLIAIDRDLMNKLKEIRTVNKAFMTNATFRDIVINGTMSAKGARMLVEAYPDLSSYIGIDRTRRKVKTRRAGRPNPSRKDYLDYDIEYGLLYY